MSKLSEEEILDKLRKMLYHTQKANECGLSNNDFKEDIETLEGILDLYNKEKEKNKELKEKYSNKLIDFQKEREEYEKDYISKDKVKEKIEVLNTNIVNAERFDGDYIGNCRFAKYILQELLEGDK